MGKIILEMNTAAANNGFELNLHRLPQGLQAQFDHVARRSTASRNGRPALEPNQIYEGDSLKLLPEIAPNSVAVSFWSPPYFLGKEYETHLTFEGWKSLLSGVIGAHFPVIKPGGFMVINISDILCFADPKMPKVQHDVVRKGSPVTTEQVVHAAMANPGMNRYELAALLKCSEQTIDRRLNGNNIRGGKYKDQTRVKIVGGLLEEWAEKAGFYLYDRRIWVKDAAWENSRWHSLSYRSVDESEYIYIFWKPGVTKYDRNRLSAKEWVDWGARGVWHIPSVRINDNHPAKFPVELARRVIRLFSALGELVLDPFVGSGTTVLAAAQEKRRFIGIDSQKKYVQIARNSLSLWLRAHVD